MTTQYRITAPVSGLNGPGVGGITFKDSIAETDNKAIVDYCKAAGYAVEKADEPIFDLSTARVDELKAYAAEHNIDLGEATLKADIVDVISQAPLEPVADPSAEQA